jgi:hypothetical protein
MLPIQVPSMRTWGTRLPPSSTTVMFICCPISFPFRSAASMTLRASSCVTMNILSTEEKCNRHAKTELHVAY